VEAEVGAGWLDGWLAVNARWQTRIPDEVKAGNNTEIATMQKEMFPLALFSGAQAHRELCCTVK
jgi:hypothetical protein